MITGHCKYAFNPSEQYQMHTPGGGVESHCGAVTYAISDEPEIVAHTIRPAEGNPYIEFVKTGVLLERSQADPYCPKHGGTVQPQAPIVVRAEVIEAIQRAKALQLAYQAQLPLGLTQNGDVEFANPQITVGQE